MKKNKKAGFHGIVSCLVLLMFTLYGTNVHAQDKYKTDRYVYHPKLLKSMDMAKATVSRVLNDRCVSIIDTTLSGKRLKYKKAAVFDEGIQLKLRSGTKMIYFSKLFGDRDIYLSMWYMLYYNAKTGVKYRDEYGDAIIGTNKVYFSKHKAGFGVTMPSPSYYPTCDKELSDALFTIQRKLNTDRYHSQLDLLKPLAEKYRALKVKPPMTEEQRKYVVQANYLTQHKNYGEAIRLYKKVIAMDPTCYPGAYYNLALLFAQQNSFDAAIFYMREYLLLEPDAKDARAAQDKIYEWDLKVAPSN